MSGKHLGKIGTLLAAFALAACTPAAEQSNTTAGQTQTQTQSSQIHLVVFHADWCPFCRAMAPIYTDVANAEKQRLRMTVIDHDANMDLVRANGVTGLPTTLVMRDGIVIERREGAMTREDLIGMINRAQQKNLPANLDRHIAALPPQAANSSQPQPER